MADERDRVRDERFASVYGCSYPEVYRYVSRRVAARSDVADLVAETFLVVWRRVAELPPAPADRLWIFGVARRVVSQHRRATARRDRLQRRLAAQPRLAAGDLGEPPHAVTTVRHAIGLLRERDRELVQLVMWDGLSHREAGVVLGCSPNAVALRLHKAKRRLRDLLATLDPAPDPDVVPATTRSTAWTWTH